MNAFISSCCLSVLTGRFRDMMHLKPDLSWKAFICVGERERSRSIASAPKMYWTLAGWTARKWVWGEVTPPLALSLAVKRLSFQLMGSHLILEGHNNHIDLWIHFLKSRAVQDFGGDISNSALLMEMECPVIFLKLLFSCEAGHLYAGW